MELNSQYFRGQPFFLIFKKSPTFTVVVGFECPQLWNF